MLARRLLPFVASLFVCLAATAATVEQRSPFRQGHWWDPSRPGHGFELLNAGGQVFAVWYTYDDAGAPVWYTAQGAEASLGEAWALQKHRWSEGRIAQSTTMGSMKLRVVDSERIEVDWEVANRPGKWTIQPFLASGVVNEVDLTGHWYVPSNSGWGMTVVDQGEVFGGVVYFYDADGAPTWVAGFDRWKGTRIDLYATRGTCPSCPYQPATPSGVGSIDIDYRGDSAITIRGAPGVPLPAGLRIDGAHARQLGRPASARAADRSLATFHAEAPLRAFIADGLNSNRYYSSGADFSASPPAPSVDFSNTNVQEAGVDEADLMKTDGRHVYTYSSDNSRLRVAYVDGGQTLEPRGEFALQRPGGSGASSYYSPQAGLYLHDGNLVSLRSSYLSGWWYSPGANATPTIVEVMSLADPARPAERWRAELSGTLVSSRRVGDRLYVITRFAPQLPQGFVYGATTEAQREANRALVGRLPITTLLPTVSVNGEMPMLAVALGDVHLPPQGGRSPLADMVVVTAIDLKAPGIVHSLAVLGRTDTVYATPSSLYLASSRYELRSPVGTLLPEPPLYVTDLHKIRLGGDGMSFVASGSIEGTLGHDIDKSAFRLSEHQGMLRVVSSSMSGMWGDMANRVTILEPSSITPGLLKTVSWLPNPRRPQRLGKPNEMLYGTRFVGERLYAVTFKKTDPLYVVDLSNSSDPRITGELEIPGFSDYLHPLANGLMLGFGKDARPSGTAGDGQFAWFQGLQLTLFDVSGNAPREMNRIVIGKRGSQSALLSSHRAFSALARPDGSVAIGIPASVADGAPTYGSGDSTSYSWDYSGLLRFELRGSTPADATLTQLDPLVARRAGGGSSGDDTGAGYNGRSVLFNDATIYVGGGKFWRRDAAGIVSGPF